MITARDRDARGIVLAMLCGLSLVPGCATSPTPTDAPRPVVISTDGSRMRVTVIGPLPTRPHAPTARGRLANFLYGPETETASRFRRPQGLAVGQGALFACDQGLSDVLRYDPIEQTLLSWIRLTDRPTCPVAVASDTSGVYVVDAAERTVLMYDPRGRRVRRITPPSIEDYKPTAVAVHDGVLFITDSVHHVVHRVRLDTLEWLPSWGAEKGADPLALPSGLTVTARGELLVSDAMLGLVHRFDQDGKRLRPLGEYGGEEGQLVRPMGVVEALPGVILIADAGRESLVGFDSDGKPLFETGGHRGDWGGMLMPSGLASFDMEREPASGEPPQPSTSATIAVSDTLSAQILLLELEMSP